MDATLILDRIQKLELLKNDSTSQWEDVVKKHPYFSIGQWLKYGADYLHDKGALNNVAIFKTEPLEFAKFIKEIRDIKDSKAVSVESVIEVKEDKVIETKVEEKKEEKEIVENKSIKEESVVSEIEKEIEPLKEEIVEVQGTELIEEPLALVDDECSQPESVETKPEELKSETSDSFDTVVEEIRETSPVVEKVSVEEDILELINELPNTAAFEMPSLEVEEEEEVDTAPILKSEAVEGNELNITENEEDKSLMVMMSFTDWLTHFKHKTSAEREEERAQKALKAAWQKGKLAEAADEELEEIPEPIFKQAMDSISMESSLISESLAEILAKQGKKDKAIAMYKKLSLRNPEKSTFFANRINELNLNED